MSAAVAVDLNPSEWAVLTLCDEEATHGFALARAETAAVVQAVIARFPNLGLASGAITWRPSGMFRSPESLWLNR